MVYIGLVILVLTIWAMIKRIEARMVLIVAGLAMAIISGDPMAAFKGLTKGMTESDLICNICSVMGFAFVMNYTGCDTHLGQGVSGFLRYMNKVLIPGAVLATFFVNISLPSAAGVSAAVGSVVIPLLISQGVSPAMAGASVMMGTYGSMLSPGLPHNPFVARIATQALGHEVTVMDVISRHYSASVTCGVVSAGLMMFVALALRENKGYVDKDNTFAVAEGFKVNPLYAVVPVIPVCMLVLGASFPQQLPWLAKLRVEHCMLIGAIIGLVATRKNPLNGSKSFFNGLGKGYGDIMGIVIAAAVFVAGMTSIGLVQAGINIMKMSQSAATIAAAVGPMVLAIICGSGHAATIAFNEAVTLHAASFGVDVVDMGALATLAGCLGRCMSPLAGAAIVCAGLAHVNPMEIAKRTALPSIVAMVVGYFMLIGF